MKQKHCLKCGLTIDHDAKFCKHCERNLISKSRKLKKNLFVISITLVILIISLLFLISYIYNSSLPSKQIILSNTFLIESGIQNAQFFPLGIGGKYDYEITSNQPAVLVHFMPSYNDFVLFMRGKGWQSKSYKNCGGSFAKSLTITGHCFVDDGAGIAFMNIGNQAAQISLKVFTYN